MNELILYACPIGQLAAQIEDYFRQSRQRYGPNAAHAYMPHCTLTGFFEADDQQIHRYVGALELATAKTLEEWPKAAIAVQALQFHPHWHGLVINSEWLLHLAANFAQQAPPAPVLRLKSWLHLSLAYGFDPDQGSKLKHLALVEIDPIAAVSWELRLYQRCEDKTWYCHRNIPIQHVEQRETKQS